MLAIRLSPKIEKRLQALARKTGRSKTFYAREAIVEYLDDFEDFYLAEQRMKGYRQSQAIPLDDVVRRYGLEG